MIVNDVYRAESTGNEGPRSLFLMKTFETHLCSNGGRVEKQTGMLGGNPDGPPHPRRTAFCLFVISLLGVAAGLEKCVRVLKP